MNETNVKSAGAAKWAWKAGGTLPPLKMPVDIRIKAALQAAAMLAVAFLVFHFRHRVIMPAILCGLATAVLVGGFFVPPVFHAFEKFGKNLGKWVGTGLTWLLLVPFYFIIFAPAHWIMSARGIDPMAREFPTKLPTYWIPRKPSDSAQYKKQH